MAKQVQFRRGTTSQHSTFTGAVGEITVDTDKDTVVIHDGSTAGGNPLPTSLSDLGVTATASELNTLDGVPATLTATELGYVDGVTSAIQTQLDAKVDLAGDTMTGALILNADPTAALGAATKSYVDTIAAAGIHYHTAVRVEAPSNLNATYDNGTAGVGATLTNAGTQAAISIDGVALSLNDRVLVYNQTNAAHNGIYYVSTVGDGATNWVLTRATDADSYGASDSDALGEGDAFFVKEGDTGAGELYVMSTSGTITFGTTAINFTVIAETAVYTAGTDITLDGTTFNLNSTIAADTTGNAATATAWQTARSIALTGDVTGTATGVDGSGNVSITTTVADDSHNHVIANVDGLQTALDTKAPTASPTITGTATISGLTYPTSDGTNGQVLTTDGAGALSFSTISGYTDSDVDTHLNTGTAANGEFLSWNGTDYDWAAVTTTVAIDDLTDANTTNSGVGLGSGALSSITSGIKNVAVGANASRDLTTGSEAVSIGFSSGLINTTASYNVSIGSEAGYYNPSGDNNVAIGRRALYGASGQANSRNTAVGTSAGSGVTTSNNNVFVGYLTGSSVTSGGDNTFLGAQAGRFTTTATYNTAVGTSAMINNTTGYENVSVGREALYYNSTGPFNTAIGKDALKGTSGSSQARNTAVGYQALLSVGTNGDQNTAVGERSLDSLTTGTLNTALGSLSGAGLTTGGDNVFLGANAGSTVSTGTNNICIGKSVQVTDPTISNEIVIGKSTHDRLLIGSFGSSANDGKALVWDDTANTFAMSAVGGFHEAYDSVTLSTTASSVEFTSLPAGNYRLIGSDINLTSQSGVRFFLYNTSGTAQNMGQNGYRLIWSQTSYSTQNRYANTNVIINEGELHNPTYGLCSFIVDFFSLGNSSTRPNGFYKFVGRKGLASDDGFITQGGWGCQVNTNINKIGLGCTSGSFNTGSKFQLLKLS